MWPSYYTADLGDYPLCYLWKKDSKAKLALVE